ncbi:MAG TPA: hypothetical protein VHB78_17630 [Vicinamibacterales bacterium]|nr:hypothetical protein [Vicinamibacterales bacterium]
MLDERGLSYLVERLSLGFTLAKTVASTVNGGIIEALVPDTASDSAIYAFSHGMGISARYGVDEAVSVILEQKAKADTAMVIAESATVPPDASEVSTWPFDTFSRHDELYGVVSGPSMKVSALERLLTLTDAGYLSNVFVVTRSTSLQPLENDIAKSAIDNIVRNVSLAFVRAYDGESYLVWRPSS